MAEASNVISLRELHNKVGRPKSRRHETNPYGTLCADLRAKAERWKAKGDGYRQIQQAADAIELLAAAVSSAAADYSVAVPVTSLGVSDIGVQIVDVLWQIDAAEAVLPEEGQTGYGRQNRALEVLYDRFDALCGQAWCSPARSLADIVTLAIIARASDESRAHGALVSAVLRMGGAINV